MSCQSADTSQVQWCWGSIKKRCNCFLFFVEKTKKAKKLSFSIPERKIDYIQVITLEFSCATLKISL